MRTKILDSSALFSGSPEASAGRCPFLRHFRSSSPEENPSPRAPRPAFRGPTPPGPRGLPWIGSYLAFARNPLRFFERLRERHGDIVQFRLGRRLCVHLYNPEDIRNFFVRDHAYFQKGGILADARRVMGNGLLTSDGEDHRRQKRLLWPAFSPEALERYGDLMAPAARRAVEAWRDGETIDATAEMSRITLAIVGRTLFGSDFYDASPRLQRAVIDLLDFFDPAVGPLARVWSAITAFRKAPRFREACAILDEEVEALVQKEMQRPGEAKSLLSILVREAEREGTALTVKEVRDQLVTMLLAGHETVATTLNWTLYLLARHPEAQARVREEVDRVFGSEEPVGRRFEELSYVNRVVRESHRLYPPIWAIRRQVARDYPIGPYVVPAGAYVAVTQWVTHRDPRFFPEPGRFDPDRWLEAATREKASHAYFPFGGGPRSCIGAQFGLMESAVVLAAIAQRWSFSLADGQPVELRPLITLRPKQGIRLNLRRRERSADQETSLKNGLKALL